jgi:hypothetical protein
VDPVHHEDPLVQDQDFSRNRFGRDSHNIARPHLQLVGSCVEGYLRVSSYGFAISGWKLLIIGIFAVKVATFVGTLIRRAG